MRDQGKANASAFAHDDIHYERLPSNHAFWADKWRPFTVGITMVFLLWQILFLSNTAAIYGVAFKEGSRYHALNILEVNLDGNTSFIQSSLTTAYSTVQGPSFPTVNIESSSAYSNVQAAKDAVCAGNYWAALVVNDGSTANLTAALAGGAAAASYTNTTSSITMIRNSVRYPAVATFIEFQLNALADAAGNAFNLVDSAAINSLNTSDNSAVSVYRNPFTVTTIDIMTTSQGGRIFYNEITMVLPIIQMFVFLMAINGLMEHFKFYTRLQIPAILLIRAMLAFSYTFISALCQTGLTWAFKETWTVTDTMFVETWMLFWLYSLAQFVILDTASAVLHLSWFAFFFLTWGIQNLAAVLVPYELTAGFYRWTYALPSRNAYDALITIWGSGCNPSLDRTIPILFAWFVVFFILANLGMYHRCKIAVRREKSMLETAAKMFEIRGWPKGPKHFSDTESAASEWENTIPGHAQMQAQAQLHGPAQSSIAVARGSLETVEVTRPSTMYNGEATSPSSLYSSVRMSYADTAVEGIAVPYHTR